jgi:hypothetical protein
LIKSIQVLRTIKQKSKWKASWKYMMPNGEMRTHLGYGSPSFLADGSIVFNSVILDVTNDVKKIYCNKLFSKLKKIGVGI